MEVEKVGEGAGEQEGDYSATPRKHWIFHKTVGWAIIRDQAINWRLTVLILELYFDKHVHRLRKYDAVEF